MMENNQLSDGDILRFLRLAYFGSIDEPYNAAGDRAYRDFCRTIRFNKTITTTDNRKNVKRNVYEWIHKELISLKCFSVDDFNSWHDYACKIIIKDFSTEAKLCYGQAQKWLNMTLKYLLVLDVYEAKKLLVFLHVPIDKKVIHTAAKHVTPCQKPWSQWNESEYQGLSIKT